MLPPSPAAPLLWALRRAVRTARGRLRLGGAVMHGPTVPAVALTFDDGPDPSVTPTLLDILRDRGAQATFFMVGTHVARWPALARRVAAEQEIGCHSYAHARGIVQRPAAFEQDLARCRELFTREIGQVPRFYRFPWGNPGRVDPRDIAARFGLTCVHWSGSSGDDQHDADTITRRVERALEPGAILLLHDGCGPGSAHARSGTATVEALPRILDAIAARGLSAVTIGELLKPENR